MIKFIRRVFILLVLFCIAFLIFRIAKPDLASNFVAKVKSIPQTISSRFHRDQKIVIDSETTSITWDILWDDAELKWEDNEVKNEEDQTWNSQKTWDSYADLLRLQELNAEIEAIMNSGKNTEVDNENTASQNEDTWNSGIGDTNTENDITVTEIKQDTQQSTSETTTNNNSQSTNTTNSNNKNTNKWWLSQWDYDEASQIMNMFQ